MTHFTARIELHNPTDEACQALTREMTAAGFAGPMPPDAKSPFGAGASQYSRDCDQALNGVFDSARRAAGRTGVAFSVMVCEEPTKRWIGLNVPRSG